MQKRVVFLRGIVQIERGASYGILACTCALYIAYTYILVCISLCISPCTLYHTTTCMPRPQPQPQPQPRQHKLPEALAHRCKPYEALFAYRLVFCSSHGDHASKHQARHCHLGLHHNRRLLRRHAWKRTRTETKQRHFLLALETCRNAPKPVPFPTSLPVFFFLFFSFLIPSFRLVLVLSSPPSLTLILPLSPVSCLFPQSVAC